MGKNHFTWLWERTWRSELRFSYDFLQESKGLFYIFIYLHFQPFRAITHGQLLFGVSQSFLSCAFTLSPPRELQQNFGQKNMYEGCNERIIVPPDTQRIKSTGFQIAVSSYFDSRINIYSSYLATLCSWWLRPHLRDACTQHRQYNFL